EGFEMIWRRIADFKLRELDEALFLSQCDTTPMIDEPSRQEGIKHLQPLLDLWKRGKEEKIIKPISDYLLYAYTISPLSFLMLMQKREVFKITNKTIEEGYQVAWDAIRL
ncbi:MAG: TetR/AcrR family transcriptional regulator, partial [Cellulophaga sp.]|nr:TetR/AcrR family transcriptional regulator [Cellulophaga sp.]